MTTSAGSPRRGARADGHRCSGARTGGIPHARRGTAFQPDRRPPAGDPGPDQPDDQETGTPVRMPAVRTDQPPRCPDGSGTESPRRSASRLPADPVRHRDRDHPRPWRGCPAATGIHRSRERRPAATSGGPFPVRTSRAGLVGEGESDQPRAQPPPDPARLHSQDDRDVDRAGQLGVLPPGGERAPLPAGVVLPVAEPSARACHRVGDLRGQGVDRARADPGHPDPLGCPHRPCRLHPSRRPGRLVAADRIADTPSCHLPHTWRPLARAGTGRRRRPRPSRRRGGPVFGLVKATPAQAAVGVLDVGTGRQQSTGRASVTLATRGCRPFRP